MGVCLSNTHIIETVLSNRLLVYKHINQLFNHRMIGKARQEVLDHQAIYIANLLSSWACDPAVRRIMHKNELEYTISRRKKTQNFLGTGLSYILIRLHPAAKIMDTHVRISHVIFCFGLLLEYFCSLFSYSYFRFLS